MRYQFGIVLLAAVIGFIAGALTMLLFLFSINGPIN